MAQPISASNALSLLSNLHSADIVLPTTDGREICLRRITELTTEQKSLLQHLGHEAVATAVQPRLDLIRAPADAAPCVLSFVARWR